MMDRDYRDFQPREYPFLGSSALCVGGFHAKQPATGSALFRSCRHCHLCLQGRNHEGGLRRHGPRSTRSRRGRVRVGNHIGRQRSPTTLPRTLQTSFQRGVCAPGYSSAPAVRTGDLVLMGPCALVAAGRAHSPPGTTLPVRTARPCTLRTSFRWGYAQYAFPLSSAVRTGDRVPEGVCALVAAVSAHSPPGTTPPARTARPHLSRQRARPTSRWRRVRPEERPRPPRVPPIHECSPPARRRSKTAGRGKPPAALQAHVNRRGAFPVHECSGNG